MKKGLVVLSLVVTFFALSAVSASAVTNDTVKVGLRYGSSVMSSANLENDDGRGYEFGYFEDDRTFVSLGETDETAITMEPMSRGGIQVVITGTDQVLWETEEDTLAVMPQGRDPVTWFRGNRYRGGFEYTCTGSALQVVNVVGFGIAATAAVMTPAFSQLMPEKLPMDQLCRFTISASSAKVTIKSVTAEQM